MAAGRRRVEAALLARGAIFIRGGKATDLRRWTPQGVRLVEVREGALLAGEIVGWILAELGEPLVGAVEDRLLEVLRELSHPVRVLVHDAGPLPAPEWQRLERLVAAAHGRLQIVAHDSTAAEPAPAAPQQPIPVEGTPASRNEETEPAAPPAPSGPAEAWLPTEALRALGQLIGALRQGATLVALAGPAGAGKTIVLRALARRLRPEFDPVFVPFMALEEAEFLRWMLHCRGAPTSDADIQGAWRRELDRARARGMPVVLLIDDAGALPHALAQSLAAWADQRGGDLRLVLGLCEGAGPSLPPLPGLERVRLLGALERGEARRMLARSQGDSHGSPARPVLQDEEVEGPGPEEIFRDAEHEQLRNADLPEASSPDPIAAPQGPLARRVGTVLVVLAVLLMSLVFLRAAQENAPQRVLSTAMTVQIDARPGTQILVDGRALGAAPLGPLLLSKGPHRIRAVLPDGRVVEREIVIDERLRRFQVHP